MAELEAYRDEADRFIAALDEEYYLHFAGLKDEFELAPIYERFSDLTTLDACQAPRRVRRAGPRRRELWRFACEGYLGDLTRADAEEIARPRGTLEATVDGEEIGYRLLRPSIANEPDRGRRERLDRARVTLTEEHLNERHVRIAETHAAATRARRGHLPRPLRGRFGFPLEELAAQCERFLEETEDLYVRTLDRALPARVGIGLDEAKRWDVPRLFRASEWDTGFPGRGNAPGSRGNASPDLGIDLEAQENVHLDIESRPTKSPRAFCAPIEVPGRVMLVIQPIGGPDDWHALFHEAGHTEHYAHTSADLPVEARRLGDNAVTEGWAMLLELLVNEPRLARATPRLRAAGGVRRRGVGRPALLRPPLRGKLLYELELHGETELESMRGRYVERCTTR